MRRLGLLSLATVLTGAVLHLAAQSSSDAGLAVIQQWLKQQAGADAAPAKNAAAKASTAQKKPNQEQSIAIDHGSTTFVDRSSATDLLSAALNLVPVNGAGASSSSGGGSGTVTASLYSIYALASRQNPVLPSPFRAARRGGSPCRCARNR
jgi:hypothetical protein